MMLISIAKEIAVNPKHVTFIGTVDQMNDEGVKQHKTVVFIAGCPSGLQSDYTFDETQELLNDEG